MRNIGNSGKTAVGAVFAALALLVLTGITLHETVFMWFLAACMTAYVACVAQLLIRRRHKTLAASGFGSILFIAFAIAFLRQWGLAFNPDPEALSAPVNSEHPDLYFYLAAASGAATLFLLSAGTLLPARGYGQRSRGTAPRPPVSRPASRPPARSTTSRPGASRASAPRGSAPRMPKPPVAGAKRPAAAKPARTQTPVAKPAVKKPVKPAAKAPTRPAAPTSRRY